MKHGLNRLSRLVMGKHPNNTIFSFNWVNVRHINSFYRRASKVIYRDDLVIADIGGGHSPYFFHFSHVSRDYIVVDFKEALPDNETRPISQMVGTAESIPLEDNSVDIVLCNQVLEHVIDPKKSISEVHRILKPGGRFLGSVPHVSPIHLEPYDFRRYTTLGVERLLCEAGFRNIFVDGNGGVFSAAALMIAMDILLSKRIPGKPQKFQTKLSIVLFPVIGCLNSAGVLADSMFGDRRRTPANLCWDASRD